MQFISLFLLLLPALAIPAPFLQPDSHDKASDSNYDEGIDKHIDKASDSNYDKGMDKYVDKGMDKYADKSEEEVEKLLELESVSLDIASNIYDQEVAWLKKYEKESVIPDQAIEEELERLRELLIVRNWQEALHNELAGREVYDLLIKYYAGRVTFQDLLSNVQKLALNFMTGHPSFEVDK